MPVFWPFCFPTSLHSLLRPLRQSLTICFVREAVFTLPPRRTVPVKKVFLIVNPYGGKGRGKIVLEAALGTLALHIKVHHRCRRRGLAFSEHPSEQRLQCKRNSCALLSITCVSYVECADNNNLLQKASFYLTRENRC